ncbi:MAG: amidohydrolase, partial [Pseudomonadota bacterium]
APNVVPDLAEVYYYVRYSNAETLKQIWQRVVNTAEGAALGTGTKMKYEIMHGNHSVLPNETLAKLVDTQLRKFNGVVYNSDEKAFAEKIYKTLLKPRLKLGSETEVQPFKMKHGKGSTDVGDISWVVPTVGLRTATWTPGTSAHSWQAIAAGGMSIGHKGMLLASKTLANTAIQLFQSPETIKSAREEFMQRRGVNFAYEALLGDRKPPLDYRK